MKVVLIHPEIPWNTGNIGRTCVASGSQLHLVGPLGFSLSERRLRRAGMDYWEQLSPVFHPTLDAFLALLPPGADVLAFSAEGPRTHWQARYSPESWLIFGSESKGLPSELRLRWAQRLYRVPMRAGARSLNLSTAAAVVLYEGMRAFGGVDAPACAVRASLSEPST